MGIVKGYTAIGGWKKSTTWGTAVAIGAGEGIRFTEYDPSASIELLASDELSGSRSRKAGDRGNILHAPALTCEGQYEGLERLFAQAFGSGSDGTASGAPTQVGLDDAYTHLFKPQNELDGVHGTLAFYHQSKPSVTEYSTNKVNGMTLNVGSGQQKSSIQFPMIGHKRSENEGSGTNTTTTAANITFPSNRDFINFAHLGAANGGGVYINTASGGALGASDILYPSQIQIEILNSLPADDVTPAHAPYIDEPIGGDFFAVNISMTFTKGYQNLAIIRDMMSESAVEYKGTIAFFGPIADAAVRFSLKFWFPSMQFTGDPPGLSGPDRQSETLNFQCNRVDTAPTGFTAGYTDACTVELVNQNSADALA